MIKKFSSIALAGALTVAALVGVSAPAQAAAKANAACATPGAKTPISKISYVCGQNPLVTAKKNIWLSPSCVSANKSYAAAIKQRDGLTTSFNNAITKINEAITVNTTDAAQWQTKIDKYTATINSYLATHPNVATTGTANDKKSLETLKSAVAALTSQVARVNSRVTSLKSQLQSTQDSQGALIQSAADNVATLKSQLSTICKSGL